MSIESTPPSLPGLTGVTIYRAEGPRGILKIAVRTDASVLAERLSQLWLHGSEGFRSSFGMHTEASWFHRVIGRPWVPRSTA